MGMPPEIILSVSGMGMTLKTAMAFSGTRIGMDSGIWMGLGTGMGMDIGLDKSSDMGMDLDIVMGKDMESGIASLNMYRNVALEIASLTSSVTQKRDSGRVT